MITPIHSGMSIEEATEVYWENMRSLFSPGLNGGMVLIVDVTGSMSGIIRLLMQNITKYTDTMFKGQIERMSLICMDDHYVPYGDETLVDMAMRGASPAVKFKQTTNNPKEFKEWLRDYPRGSGGDAPEAWACSIDHARRLDPEANIWLCTDAPPHGLKLNGGHYGDSSPKGCQCTIPLNMDGVNLLFFSPPCGWQPPEISGGKVNPNGTGWGSAMFKEIRKNTNPDALMPISINELDLAFKKFLGGK